MPTPKLGKYLGRRKDHPDHRDRILPTPYVIIGVPLPSSANVFAGLSLPVYDQENLGSCTANCWVLVRRFLAQKFYTRSQPDQDLSRLWLYFRERKLPWNNDVSQDSGAEMRDGCNVLAHFGVPPERDDPYDVTKFADSTVNDSTQSDTDAVRYEIQGYHRILDLPGLKNVLAHGYAVAMGFTVYASFENIGPDGIMPIPEPGDDALGGHAVCIYGYDDSRQQLLIRNSWGSAWGMSGDFWMPYEFATQQLAQGDIDLWLAHL